jgi:hypothetical protein
MNVGAERRNGMEFNDGGADKFLPEVRRWRSAKTDGSVTVRTPLLLDLQNRYGYGRLVFKMDRVVERPDSPSDMHGNRHLG